MKKILLLIMAVFLLTACNKKQAEDTYSGQVTNLSKKHLSKGYIVNIYRTATPLSEKIEDMGKGYITMVFRVLVDHYSLVYDNKEEYIKKQIVSNIKIKKSPKMGTIGDIYGNYQSYSDPDYKMVGSKNRFVKEYKEPIMYGMQNSIAVELDNIAFVDSAKYPGTPSTKELYDALGITRDSVALTITFRIELITVSDKVLYKDYEIEIPPKSFDISGSEFRTDFITEDVNEMQPYLEK